MSSNSRCVRDKSVTSYRRCGRRSNNTCRHLPGSDDIEFNKYHHQYYIVQIPRTFATHSMFCSYQHLHITTVHKCGIHTSGVGVSHLKETLTPRPISVSSGLLCNSVAVCLTFVQFILQLKLCLHTTVHLLLE